MGQLWGFVPGEASGFLKEVWGMEERSHSSPLVLEKAKAWGSRGALWSSSPDSGPALPTLYPVLKLLLLIKMVGVEAGKVRTAGCPVLSGIGCRKWIEGKEKDVSGTGQAAGWAICFHPESARGVLEGKKT